MVCKRLMLTKVCVKDWRVKDGGTKIVAKMMCKRICERWCVSDLLLTKMCVKDGVKEWC